MVMRDSGRATESRRYTLPDSAAWLREVTSPGVGVRRFLPLVSRPTCLYGRLPGLR